MAASIALAAVAGSSMAAEAPKAFRPPAVPLVAHDPYLSIWSCADRLTDDATRHWTGAKHSLVSLIRVDGKTFRLMGDEPKSIPAMEQKSVRVLPTRSIYEFQSARLQVTLTFLTPALCDDLDVLSRPLTYLTWDVRALDGEKHAVSVYLSASGELAVHDPAQHVTWSRPKAIGLSVLQIGSSQQPVLQRKGDGTRIDWGYAYLAAPAEAGTTSQIGSGSICTRRFVDDGRLASSPDADDPRMPRAASDDAPTMAIAIDAANVGAETVSRYAMIAYDDEYSINYFGQRLRPYWRRSGAATSELLRTAAKDYPALQSRCTAFDDELMKELASVGGDKYATLCALAYRQALAGSKLVADADGSPLLFPKENTSNGCIATVDVIYPMAPQFLLLSPTLAKASLVPVLNYAASSRWKFPFAPHDLGTYPQATAQVYGGGERTEENQMPVEESGNMILLVAAIAKIDGNADFAAKWWPQITKWAEYLETKGFDPEKQLCTDDFAGHLAHNTNLSIKAIEAIGAYGMLCEMRGDAQAAGRYKKLATELAAKWIATANDGDHYRLVFDGAGTWSQKYNIVWDRLLGLNLFPADVARKEIAFYRTKLNRFGLPLDSRKEYTKTDWTLWTAALAESREDFEALVAPVFTFADETPQRVGFSDFYWTQNAHDAGMHARPVIGGVFIKMLADTETWKKWASRDRAGVSTWAAFPPVAQITEVVPTARQESASWHYTLEKPAENWNKPEFKTDAWKQGQGGFGTAGTPGAIVKTTWDSADIYLRREFSLPSAEPSSLQLIVHHDEDAEIYINGVLAASVSGYRSDYDLVPISDAALKTLKPGGENTLAVYCHQTVGGQYIDVGIAKVAYPNRK